MKFFPLRLSVVAFALAMNVAGRAQTTITIDELASLPPRNDFAFFAPANNGSLTINGITFDSHFVPVGDQYVERYQNNGPGGAGTNPFIQPHSGNFGVFNDSAMDALTITTTRVLLGVWLARPDFGNGIGGATAVTIKALNGGTVLSSVSMNLTTGATMQFMDTSSFTGLSGITGYEIDRTATGSGPFGGGHYVADDFTFAAIPEPAAMAAVLGGGALGLAFWRRRRGAKALTEL